MRTPSKFEYLSCLFWWYFSSQFLLLWIEKSTYTDCAHGILNGEHYSYSLQLFLLLVINSSHGVRVKCRSSTILKRNAVLSLISLSFPYLWPGGEAGIVRWASSGRQHTLWTQAALWSFWRDRRVCHQLETQRVRKVFLDNVILLSLVIFSLS